MTALAGLLPLALTLADPSATGAAQNIHDQYQRWEQRLRARVTELHQYPGVADRQAAGSVAVKFAIGPDGRPQDAVVQRSSGNALFDKAAMQLVGRLGRIGPVPSNSGKQHRVTLNLSYGDVAEAGLLADRRFHEQQNRRIVSAGASWPEAAASATGSR